MSSGIPLSIIVAGRNAPEMLKCLDALYPQAQAVDAEMIVAESSYDGADEAVHRRFPKVGLLHFSIH